MWDLNPRPQPIFRDTNHLSKWTLIDRYQEKLERKVGENESLVCIGSD
jgi:hypothetical protein